MSFAKQHFGHRFGRMGDEAENVFEQVAPYGVAHRYGWNREPNFRFMPRHVALTPDYYTNNGYLVEVMGCSGDFFNAMKVDKWEGMKDWQRLSDGKLVYFIWNTGRKMWAMVPHDAMRTAVARSKRADQIKTWEVDDVSYYQIDWEWIIELAEAYGVYYG